MEALNGKNIGLLQDIYENNTTEVGSDKIMTNNFKLKLRLYQESVLKLLFVLLIDKLTAEVREKILGVRYDECFPDFQK